MARARISDIITIAAHLSGMPVETIKGNGRYRRIVRVRQAICYVARESGYSYPQIGEKLGGRDHSTIIHGVDAAMAWAERNPDYASFLERLKHDAANAGPFVPLPARITSIIADLPPAPPKPRPAPKKRKNQFDALHRRDQREADQMAVASKALADAIREARAA